MKRLRSKLTYSNVMVTVLAFVVLGGGTAFAASQFAKESIPNKALKKESIGPGKLSKAAKATLVGAPGPKGATGPAGPQGPAGTALGFAQVSDAGAVNQALSSNVGGMIVTHPVKGQYCILGLPFTPRNAIAMAQFDNAHANGILGNGFENCPANTQVSIDISDNAGSRDSPFLILFN